VTRSQRERAKAFAALHHPGRPLVLFNIWDAGTARAVAGAGAKAIVSPPWAWRGSATAPSPIGSRCS